MQRKVTGERKKPPKDAEKNIRMIVAKGGTKVTLRKFFRISDRLLNAWLETYPELKAAMEEGKDAEHQKLVTQLMAMATKGNIAAVIFALKSRHGYRELEPIDNGNKLLILSLQGPAPPEMWVSPAKREKLTDDSH